MRGCALYLRTLLLEHRWPYVSFFCNQSFMTMGCTNLKLRCVTRTATSEAERGKQKRFLTIWQRDTNEKF
ncbi:hypothetical protein BS78_01G248800 [Paspalum vaginatum]|nr:hypothetical protein BS78_01G248800 [Paspalum vaginatum]